MALSSLIRSGRLREGLTQAGLGKKLNVHQAAVAHWEAGTAQPSTLNLARLEEVLGLLGDQQQSTATHRESSAPASDLSAYGVWLRQAREGAHMSAAELAKAAGVSTPTIYNIESGKAKNPQASTRQLLETALKKNPPPEVVEDTEKTQQIEGLGPLSDFDPHDQKRWPTCSGVYVLYDVSERPIYVGKAGNSIAARLNTHSEKFWFREPIIKYGSYIYVADKTLRHQLEQVLIKFLKSNAVINKQSTDSFDPE